MNIKFTSRSICTIVNSAYYYYIYSAMLCNVSAKNKLDERLDD
jgi:hypothetical protein